MSEPIKVGDLVVVVRNAKRGRGCRCKPTPQNTSVGRVFRVGSISMSSNRRCIQCDTLKPNAIVARPEACPKNLIYTLDRLKRIPDFPELLTERRDEEITA